MVTGIAIKTTQDRDENKIPTQNPKLSLVMVVGTNTRLVAVTKHDLYPLINSNFHSRRSNCSTLLLLFLWWGYTEHVLPPLIFYKFGERERERKRLSFCPQICCKLREGEMFDACQTLRMKHSLRIQTNHVLCILVGFMYPKTSFFFVIKNLRYYELYVCCVCFPLLYICFKK